MKFSSPILAFTLASTSIHAGLFIMTGSTNIALPGSAGSTMTVKLEKTGESNKFQPETTGNNKTSSLKKQKQLNKLSKKTLSFSETLLKKQNTDLSKMQEHIISATSEQNAHLRAQVISVVYEQFNNHFSYPSIAQRKNWQGKVLLTFRVTSKGEIKDIKLNHSSGFDILDQAAISSLKKIGKLPQATTGLNASMDIQLPIIYKLTKG